MSPRSWTPAPSGAPSSALVALVLVRGLAWAVMLPTALATVLRAWRGLSFDPGVAVVVAACGATLITSRSALHRSRAAEAFAPVRFRRWFLASATASAAAATCFAFVTFVSLELRQPTATAVFAFVTAAVLASAVGLVRMRAWGVLVGGVTSAALAAAALLAGGPWAVGLGLTAVPGAMMALGVALARLTPSVAGAGTEARAGGRLLVPTRVRVRAPVPLRVRVADARPALAEMDDTSPAAARDSSVRPGSS